jgi:hypothetical protein
MMTALRMSVLTILLTIAPALRAQDARPLREAWSDNRQFHLRLDPGRAGRNGRPCQAELTAEKDARTRRMWSRALVNDAGPALAFIRDDGKYVVTLDEYRRGGARHALVIYGPEGELLRHFLLPDLLTAADWPHVRVDQRMLTWLTGAECAFDDAAQAFVIDLSWGSSVRIDLLKLEVVRGKEERAAQRAGIPAHIAAVLYEHARGEPGQPAAPVAEAAARDVAAAPPQRPAPAARVTPALTEEQTSIVIPSGAVALEDAEHASDLDAADGVEDDAAPAGNGAAASPMEMDATEAPVADAAAAPEFESPYTDIAVPQPDPAQRVDYLAWYNALSRVAGQDGAPLYTAAIAQAQPYDGDGELLAAALRGDPAALAAPAVQAWVAANRAALNTFRAASQTDGRSWRLESADGTLIGAVLPELGALRSLSRATVIEARLLAAEGRSDDAAYACLDVLAAGAHVGSGLTLIENLVGSAMQAPAADALLDLEADPAAAQQLDFAGLATETEAAYQPTRALTDCLQAERASFMDLAQRMWTVDPQSGDYKFENAALDNFLATLGGEAPPDAARRLAAIGYEPTVLEGGLYYDALAAAAAQPFTTGQAQLTRLEQVMCESRSANPLLQTLGPAISRARFIVTRMDATRRAAILVTNLHAYKQQHGAYPESLAVFAEREFAQDPFSGTAFVYRRRDDQFTLYSLGQNGADDAGVHDQKGETNDLVFWPRPARPG